MALQCYQTKDLETAALHIVKGYNRSGKIFSVYSGSRFLRYGFFFGGYGFLTEGCLKSESNRWMGPLRYIYACWFIIFVKDTLLDYLFFLVGSTLIRNRNFNMKTTAEVYVSDNYM